MSSNRLSSVANAVRLLRCFGATTPTWGVTELSRHLDLNKSTVHRILSTLTDEGLMEQDATTGRYRLSLAVLDLAAALPTETSLHEAVLSPMTDLRNATGETVHVGVLDGHQVVYVERLHSPNTLRLFSDIGRRNDAHCTASGKVLLAYLAPAARTRLLEGWKPMAHTEHTLVSISKLTKDLDNIRRLGYGENRQESEVGVVSIAAPIRDASGSAVAAIAVAGPLERMAASRDLMITSVVQSAMMTSKRLGYVGSAR